MKPLIPADASTSPKLAFQRQPRLSVWQALAVRALFVFGMIGIALGGHWLDRSGLRDNVDGEVSFVDVVYFTAVTVTTVGYGDIVPVTDRARMFDSFVVTPIRIFVWLIFLGTAYTFVLQHQWEQFKTRMTRRTLKGHTIICGFGAGGERAAAELLRIGHPCETIIAIDPSQERIDEATALGLIGLLGDACTNTVLKAARISTAASLLVATSKDDATALVVLSARQLNAHIKISATVRAQENESLLYQAGADVVINPVSLGGHLLARSSAHHHAVDYLRDLAASDGRVVLRERTARTEELGTPLRNIATGVGLRVLRSGKAIGFWETASENLMQNDIIIEVVSVNGASPE